MARFNTGSASFKKAHKQKNETLVLRSCSLLLYHTDFSHYRFLTQTLPQTAVFHTFVSAAACLYSCVHVWLCATCLCEYFSPTHMTPPPPTPPKTDHAQSSYRVSADGSFLVSLASGMELSLTTEPLLLGGTGGGISPTASRCNISLPGDHAPSLIEWRQRKEQSKTNYSTYERRLRVKTK